MAEHTALVAKTVQQMVAEARGRIETLSPAEVAEEREVGALLVDLRESEERLQYGYIPGALPLPRGMLEFLADPTSAHHLPELDPARRIIVYCMGGGRSALAAHTLMQLGFQKVAHMAGGFQRWRLEGRAVEGVPRGG